MGKSQKHYTKTRAASHKRVCAAWFHLYEAEEQTTLIHGNKNHTCVQLMVGWVIELTRGNSQGRWKCSLSWSGR